LHSVGAASKRLKEDPAAPISWSLPSLRFARPAVHRPTAYVHIEGLRVYDWLATAADEEGVDVRIISHTTHDARQLRADDRAAGSAFVSLMAEHGDKLGVESMMFPFGFARLLGTVQRTALPDLFDRKFLINGYGNVGRSAYAAARLLGLDAVVFDPHLKPEVRVAAEAEGVRFIDRRDARAEHRQLVLSAVGERVVLAEDFEALKADAALLSLSSGQLDFDMPYLNRTATARRVVAQIGVLPTVEYTLPSGVKVTAIADGHVAGFTTGQPNITAYSGGINAVTAASLVDAKNRSAGSALRLPPQLPPVERSFAPYRPGPALGLGRRVAKPKEPNRRVQVAPGSVLELDTFAWEADVLEPW
jgi:hypothetical protein